LACSQSSAAATSPQRTSSQRHSRLSGVAAFFNDSASRKVRFMASAKRCQRREQRLLNDIRHVASGLVHRIRHRLQAARAAAEDQFLPVNHAAAIGGFKQHAVRGGAGIQPRAVHLPDGGDVVGDLLLGRAQLPAAG
jgi:hypothetical protein